MEKTNFFRDKLKVLDIAPMLTLQWKFQKLGNLDYISVDLASVIAQKKMDITQMDFQDDHFDCILCYHVLEHIEDDRKAIRELFRVLRPGGWAILQSPLDPELVVTYEDETVNTPEEREREFGQHNHLRLYGRDYKERLEEAGYIVTPDNYMQSLDDSQIRNQGLLKDEVIYYCEKP